MTGAAPARSDVRSIAQRSSFPKTRGLGSKEIDFLRDRVFANAEAGIIIRDSPQTFLDISGRVASFVVSLGSFERFYLGSGGEGS
jgi:hypothetical protein